MKDKIKIALIKIFIELGFVIGFFFIAYIIYNLRR